MILGELCARDVSKTTGTHKCHTAKTLTRDTGVYYENEHPPEFILRATWAVDSATSLALRLCLGAASRELPRRAVSTTLLRGIALVVHSGSNWQTGVENNCNHNPRRGVLLGDSLQGTVLHYTISDE